MFLGLPEILPNRYILGTYLDVDLISHGQTEGIGFN
jgi:hypothetical protein